MRRKGEGDLFFILLGIFALIVVLFILIPLSFQALQYKEMARADNQACMDLGYESFVSGTTYSPQNYCRDMEGNLYYVEKTIHWKNYYNFEGVTIKPIKIGYVEVAQ